MIQGSSHSRLKPSTRKSFQIILCSKDKTNYTASESCSCHFQKLLLSDINLNWTVIFMIETFYQYLHLAKFDKYFIGTFNISNFYYLIYFQLQSSSFFKLKESNVNSKILVERNRIEKSTNSLLKTFADLFLTNLNLFYFIRYLFILVFTNVLIELVAMGNEGSIHTSSESTPASENMSSYSMHSRMRSSAESTRPPSPVEAPEPDLSHLTVEEIAQIRSVIARARSLQQEDSCTLRSSDEDRLETENLLNTAAPLNSAILCSLCDHSEMMMMNCNGGDPKSSLTVCVDCQQWACPQCGVNSRVLGTGVLEWLCLECDKQRRLLLPPRTWYHDGQSHEGHVPSASPGWTHEPEGLMETSMISSVSQTSSRSSRESRESSIFSEHMAGDLSWGGSRCGGDSGISGLSFASSHNSAMAKQVYEQNRVKGPGANLPKSESDEFSDLTSDLDPDDQTSEHHRPDGGSSADESCKDGPITSVSNQTEHKHSQHRPVFLKLINSLEPDSKADDDDGHEGSKTTIKCSANSRKDTMSAKPVVTICPCDNVSSQLMFTCHRTHQQLQTHSADVCMNDSAGLANHSDVINTYSGNICSLHRSASWHDGLSRPPLDYRDPDFFLCSRQISQQNINCSLTCPDLFFLNKSITIDDEHSCSLRSRSGLVNFSSISFDEVRHSNLTNMVYTDLYGSRHRSACGSNMQIQFSELQTITTSLSHSPTIMDLASFAADIASSTANLTSMTMSPFSNLLVQSFRNSHEEPLSPDSTGSWDSSSSSPLSPKDNKLIAPDHCSEVELSNPSPKIIEGQNSRRQKAKPPCTDWSPVIDLSPIIDVSPSVEEAEREDMLAKQMEELEKQRLLFHHAEPEHENIDYPPTLEAYCFPSTIMNFPMRFVPSPEEDHLTPAMQSSKVLKKQVNQEISITAADEPEINLFTNQTLIEHDIPCDVITKSDIESILIQNYYDKSISNILDSDNGLHGSLNDFSFSSTLHTNTLLNFTKNQEVLKSTNVIHVPIREEFSKNVRELERSSAVEEQVVDEVEDKCSKYEVISPSLQPPIKPRRKLPEPDLIVPLQGLKTASVELLPSYHTDMISKEFGDQKASSLDEIISTKCLSQQDSFENKTVRDTKSRPSPIVIQQVELEEPTTSSPYNVMQSPPTPDCQTFYTELYENSSAQRDTYVYLSPVTTPEHDTSPPKPYSPLLPNHSAYLSTTSTSPQSCELFNYDETSTEKNSFPTLPTTNHVQDVPPQPSRPPISPRKSLKNRAIPKTDITVCPLQDHQQKVDMPDYFEQPLKNESLFCSDFETKLAALTGIESFNKLPKNIAHNTGIVVYPVVGEFTNFRSRSRSVPSNQILILTHQQHLSEPSDHQAESTSADGEHRAQSEHCVNGRGTTRKLAEPPVPAVRMSRKIDAQREPPMKDKRTDSGDSSSSGSGIVSNPGSHSGSFDFNRSVDKDGRKIRRKLPLIPVGEEPVLVPNVKSRRSRPPAVTRSEGVDQDDSDLRLGDGSQGFELAELDNGVISGYYIGPSNRPNMVDILSRENERISIGLDVARCQSMSSHSKRVLFDVGKSKSLDSGESLFVKDYDDELPLIRPHFARTASLGSGPRDETDEIIDSLISIYGIPCTEALRSLKRRVQEEVRRVTRDRRMKLEELEEMRALQLLHMRALKLESDVNSRNRSHAGQCMQTHELSDSQQQNSHKREGSPSQASHRTSPQVTPRRQRHKRQSSDPLVAKFSPIKEDKDVETDFQNGNQDKPDVRAMKYLTDDSSQSGLSDSESTRSEPVRDARYNKIRPSDYARIFYASQMGTGGSDGRLQNSKHNQHSNDEFISVSRSDQHLSARSRVMAFSLGNDETKAREEKKAMLQYEISKRKQQLEETAKLRNELLKLARARDSILDIPQRKANTCGLPRPVPRGIIKPIDDVPPPLFHSQSERSSRSREPSLDHSRDWSIDNLYENTADVGRFIESSHGNFISRHHGSLDSSRSHPNYFQDDHYDSVVSLSYSSTEYLAHRQSIMSSRHFQDEQNRFEHQDWSDKEELSPQSQPDLKIRTGSFQSDICRRDESSQSLSAVNRDISRQASGIVSSVTLPNMEDRNLRVLNRKQSFISTSVSDTDGSPASDFTPAMPLLDDVKTKSRTILRNIGSGSRPVSAEFSAGEVEDMLNGMYRVESDNSVDADEPIMKHMTEGGVTILKQIDRKRRPAPSGPHRYNFPVKRILVPRDTKDKSITGSGLGIKIVGGQKNKGSSELGAFVSAIYPIIADKLHGQVAVGDQVLEWNGVHLTGMSSEEVQDVISRTNGEIEMVIRVQVQGPSETVLFHQTNGCRSNYENIDLSTNGKTIKEPAPCKPRSTHAPINSRHGVDPRQLAAQLEGIQESASPADNSPSSSREVVTTPSISSPCSTPRSEPTSTSSDRQLRPSSSTSTLTVDKNDKEVERITRNHNSVRHRSRHSTMPEKPHSQMQTPSHLHSPTSPQQHQSVSNQQHQKQSKSANSPENNSLTKSRSSRRKQKDLPLLPASSIQEKPHQSGTADQSESNTCSSPAFNDRLRASPPLDYRLSIRAKGAKKGKDSFLFPSKSLPEHEEKGEDFGLGEIQLQISHDDFDNTLNVHVIQARNLRPQDLNGQSDPFVKLYLLPGRENENKRRSKHIANTLNPKWHQTMIFHDVARLELQNKVLEITVWDYDRFKTNDFLGELVIELKEFAFLDNKPHWYPLKEHVNLNNFELPKSTVPPPKPVILTSHKSGLPRQGNSAPAKIGPPRQGKNMGVSSLMPRDSSEEGEDGLRRCSLGTISGNGTSHVSTIREVSSATNSPLPSRKSPNSRSQTKPRLGRPLYR